MRWVLGLMLIGLAGCEAVREDGRICMTPHAIALPNDPPVTDQQNAEQCVHRWAYRLAGSTDNARDVADAVIGGCQDAIERYRFKFTDGRLAGLSIDDKRRLRDVTEAEDTKYLGDQFRATALFHVIQARAGHCKVP